MHILVKGFEIIYKDLLNYDSLIEEDLLKSEARKLANISKSIESSIDNLTYD